MFEFLNTSDKKKSFLISLAVHIAVIVIFIYSGMKYFDPPKTDGAISISFGDSDFGKGEEIDINNSSIKRNKIKEKEEDLMTQEIGDVSVTSTRSNNKKEEKEEEIKPNESTTSTLSNFFSKKTKESKGNDDKFGFKGIKEGDKNSSSYGNGIGNKGNYRLGNRKPLNRPKPNYEGNDQGVVVVKIIVDSDGSVIKADIEMKGTTLTDYNLWEQARQSALNTKWEPNKNDYRAEGIIIYNFIID